jgi:hypothetical protein
VLYGGFVAGLRAGLLFPQFPMMGESLVPADVYAMQPWWKNLLENGAGVQFVHRTVAWLIVVNTIVLVYAVHHAKAALAIRKKVYLLAVAVGIQFALGVTTLLLQVPVAVASLHQVSAFFLLGTGIYLLHSLYIRSEVDDRVSHHADSGNPGKQYKSESNSHEVAGFIHERNYVAHAKCKEEPSETEKKKHVATSESAKHGDVEYLKNDMEYVIA